MCFTTVSELMFLQMQAHKMVLKGPQAVVTVTASKPRNELKGTFNATLCVSLSPIPPQLNLIIYHKQAHVSAGGLAYLFRSLQLTVA